MLKGLKSLVAGIIAGTAVGMLFSPKKGSEIRQSFKGEVKKGGTGLTTLKSTFREMGKDIADSAKEVYEEVNTNEAVQKAKRKAQKTAKKAIRKAKKKL